LRVLRTEPGRRVLVFDGTGREAETELIGTLENGGAELKLIRELPMTTRSVEIELLQAIPKGTRMEIILQKATELGVSAIQPIITERTIVRLAGQKLITKHERWSKTVVAAAKQCGVASLPRMKPTRSFTECLENGNTWDLLLLCSLADTALPLRKVLKDQKLKKPRSIGILIGPEGDFSDAEHAAAVTAGAIAVSLGKRILRTDTAPLYILSVLDYVL
jgi:16S rRNA (uracil1498-N3)-methyltransferase